MKNFFNKNRSKVHRYTAFTLSEVIITLGIIGVLAAMTIPQLINRTQESEYRNAFKKIYSEFSSATVSIMNENGGDLQNAFSSCIDLVTQYSTKIKTNNVCPSSFVNCWLPRSNYSFLDNGSNFWNTNQSGLQLANGMLLTAEFAQSDCNSNFWGHASPQNNICAMFTVDVNGLKNPNKFGIDLYTFWLTSNGVRPMGENDNLKSCNHNLSLTYNGYGCSAKVLQNIDY